MVIGGHTSGFVPTATAEYFCDGNWHQVPTLYNHDAGLYVPLSNGKVLVAGGYETHLGIGQTYVVEEYDPATHQFNIFNGSLQMKRAHASGAQLSDGRVVVAGNWYADDSIELLGEVEMFPITKSSSLQRAVPYIFPISHKDAVIVSGRDIHNNSLNSAMADCLKGEPFEVPLLEEWQPLYTHNFNSDVCFIGDKSHGVYAYLMPVSNSAGQVAIAKVVDKEFSLLSTDCLVPMSSHGGSITWEGPIIVDSKNGIAYLKGYSTDDYRHYVLSIDYSHEEIEKGVPLKLYYTDPFPELGIYKPALTSDGNLLVVGGINGLGETNFLPSRTAFILLLNPLSTEVASISIWLKVGCMLLIVVFAILAFVFMKKRHHTKKVENVEIIPSKAVPTTENEILMTRIKELMEDKKSYLNSELRVSDIASTLGTTSRNVSDCIKQVQGFSFSQFVNNYRVEYTKQLLRERPGVKMTEIYLESGFANETSFFRTFKAVTGMTPKEWMTLND